MEVTDWLGRQLHTGRWYCHHYVLSLYWKEETLPVCQEQGIQVRGPTDLENMYHVTTNENLADVATRPELMCKKSLRGLLIQNGWHRTSPKLCQMGFWNLLMTWDGTLRKILTLTMMVVYLTGFYIKKRISLIQERAKISKYLLLPQSTATQG